MIHLSKLPSRNVRAFRVLFNKVLIDFCTFILNVKDNNVGQRKKWGVERKANSYAMHVFLFYWVGLFCLATTCSFGGSSEKVGKENVNSCGNEGKIIQDGQNPETCTPQQT